MTTFCNPAERKDCIYQSCSVISSNTSPQLKSKTKHPRIIQSGHYVLQVKWLKSQITSKCPGRMLLGFPVFLIGNYNIAIIKYDDSVV